MLDKRLIFSYYNKEIIKHKALNDKIQGLEFMENKSEALSQDTFDKYAIIQTGGKQYQAIEGKTIGIEKLDGEVGTQVEFTEVLLRKLGPENIEIGQPFLSKPVKASIVKHLKGPKLIAFKFKRRKKSRVKKGHRQSVTVVRIEEI